MARAPGIEIRFAHGYSDRDAQGGDRVDRPVLARRLDDVARVADRSRSAELRLAIRAHLERNDDENEELGGFERRAKTTSVPKSWRVNVRGRGVDMSEEQQAKAERQAAAVARVAANELERGNRHEPR